MQLVKTYVERSAISGLGVFAAEDIPAGTEIWTWVEGFDQAFTPAEVAALPEAAQEYLRNFGYLMEGEILLSGDNDRYTNHADDPNTEMCGFSVIARRAIRKGEELTADYHAFDGYAREKLAA